EGNGGGELPRAAHDPQLVRNVGMHRPAEPLGARRSLSNRYQRNRGLGALDPTCPGGNVRLRTRGRGAVPATRRSVPRGLREAAAHTARRHRRPAVDLWECASRSDRSRLLERRHVLETASPACVDVRRGAPLRVHGPDSVAHAPNREHHQSVMAARIDSRAGTGTLVVALGAALLVGLWLGSVLGTQPKLPFFAL